MAITKDMLVVAPDLGTYDEGATSFQTPRAPYYRGGGDLITTEFEASLLTHLHGTHCVVTPSGQAANAAALTALMPPGGTGHALVSNRLFGTTSVLIKQGFKAAGYEVTFFDPVDTRALINDMRLDTKLIFTEASSNPEGVVADLAGLSWLARTHDIPLVVDNTLTAGFAGFDPFTYADVVTVSLAKQSGGGNNRAEGGVVLLNDRFEWNAHTEKFQAFGRYFAADAATQKLVLPEQPLGALLRKTATWQGTCVTHMHAAQEMADSLPGLEARTTTMRANAATLADFLRDHPAVERVLLTGTDGSEISQRAKHYWGGNGFVLFMDVKGDEDATRNFINKIGAGGVVSHSVQLGQKQTAVVVPGRSTNRQSTDADLEARGMKRNSIRVSVGVERPEAIRAQFNAALMP